MRVAVGTDELIIRTKMPINVCNVGVDVGQGLGAAGADARGVRLDRARPSRGKCTTPHTYTVTRHLGYAKCSEVTSDLVRRYNGAIL